MSTLPFPEAALHLLAPLPAECFLCLTADVPNPKPDRRRKYNWTARSVWPKGLVLTFVRTVEDLGKIDPAVAGHTRTRVRLSDPRSLGDLTLAMVAPDELDGPAVLAILAHAQVHTPSVADVVKATCFGGTTILEALVQMQRLTVKDVQDAIAHLDAEPDA